MIDTDKIITQLIDQYIDFLKENGDPNEDYKYLAINTFQKYWDLEANDFYLMFRNSFSKVSNLLYQNSWGFIEKLAQQYPEEAREMFRALYDESTNLLERIKNFQNRSTELLPKLKSSLDIEKLNTQQDERTLSVYLAFRFPQKYILYKNDYYKSICKKLGIKPFKTGECFIHLQDLANQIIENRLLSNPQVINIYRSFYNAQEWDDKYLMIQNILYITFKYFNEPVDTLKDANKNNLIEYYDFLSLIISTFNLKEHDKRVVFNADKENIIFTVGQRYTWTMPICESQADHQFRAITTKPIAESNDIFNFKGEPKAHFCKMDSISQVKNNQEIIFNAIQKELNRTVSSGYIKNNKEIFEKMAFNINYRNTILNQLTNRKPKDLEVKKTTINKENNTVNKKHTPLNLILFGAPGTGKTYTLKTKYFPKYTISEKHITPEANFEEIVSGLTWWQAIALALLENGTCSVDDILENRWVTKKASLSESKSIRATIWGTLQFHTTLESTTVKYTQRQAPYIFDKTANKKWVLLKSEVSDQAPEIRDILDSINNFKSTPKQDIKHYVFTTFHQSFSYEDFIEGIKPVMEEGKETITYQIENGIFKELCLRAQNDPNNKYAIFIDEINRGNVSAIFGELITLIEPDKRIGAVNELRVKLPYSKRDFGVPLNVDIIATMNTADRSVEALDTALRRRFSFMEIQPNPTILANSEYTGVNLEKLLESINQRIEILIDKDHQIGHSYFINITSLKDLKLVFRDKIIPLLEEYFYGDYGKIGLILGLNFISLKKDNIRLSKSFSSEYDFLEEKKIYQFTDFEDWNEQTFISIYED